MSEVSIVTVSPASGRFNTAITSAFLGIAPFFAVVALERIFAGWAERPAG